MHARSRYCSWVGFLPVASDPCPLTIAPGAGESGKSTVLKQMRLIHSTGFPLQERKQWKVTIFSNLLHAFQCIQGAMEEHEVEFARPDNIVRLPMVFAEHLLVLTSSVTEIHGVGL